jgi:prevent-host-death family protein
VGAFDAKTHFSALLERVEAGESFVITKRGTPVARLVPTNTGPAPRSLAELRACAASLRAQIAASADELRSWIDEGRR